MAFKMSKAVQNFFNADVLPQDEVIDQKLTEHLAEHAALKTENEGLVQEKADLAAEVEELKKLKPMAEVGEKYLSDKRAEAESLYKLLKGDAADEEMLELIRNADIDQVKVYCKNFDTEVNEKIPLICPNCEKPIKASRRSSKEALEEKTKKTADLSSYQQG
jgi:hypothetical protein